MGAIGLIIVVFGIFTLNPFPIIIGVLIMKLPERDTF